MTFKFYNLNVVKRTVIKYVVVLETINLIASTIL